MQNVMINRSREMLEASDRILIRGCQGHKRNHKMLERGYPVFATRAKGPRFWDVDGNSYLDYLLGFGPILLGHADPVLNSAVAKQMEQGNIFSTAHEAELRAAELVLELNPWAEMAGLMLGGSAVTAAAIRVARAVTGKDVILRCGYHGWYDWTAVDQTGVPKCTGELSVTFPYNDLNALEDLLKKYDGKVAGVIVETIQEEGPEEGYLQGCIDLAHRYGALCVMDEVKTGFRVAYGGACELYNLKPDMATFGKACCNGLPGSYLVGTREVMGDDRAQACWLAATFHCELLSLVALETVTSEMRRRDGISYQHRLGQRLIDGINKACADGGVAYRLTGHPAMPQPVIEPAEEKPRTIRMLIGALNRGHYLHPGHCMFLSLAHTEADVDATIQAVAEAVDELE
ncbi:MAG: aminotransferase class III-fold pyridoxal phosphate-dependent enzyme [Phycisphaerae bacterium]